MQTFNTQQRVLTQLAGCMGALVLCVASTAHARDTAESVETVAVFPLISSRDGPKKAARTISRGFIQEFKAAAEAASLNVLEGRALRRALRKNLIAVIGRCGTDAACAAKLGEKVGAQRVVMGQVVRDGSGFTALLLVVAVEQKAILQTVAVTIENPRQSAQALREQMALLLTPRESTPIAETELADLSLPSLDEAPEDGLPSLPEIPGGQEEERQKLVEAAPAPTAPVPEPTLILMSNVPEPLPQPEIDRTLTWVGTGILGLGAALGGAGTYLGFSAKNMANRPQDDTSQLDYADDVSRAKSRAKLANMLYIGAGVAAATGLSLMLWDMLDPTPVAMRRLEVGAAPTSQGVRASFAVHW